jgi:cytochrome oxidase Cu insertion factor (SCO1/SenC/PrrC family)
MAGLLLLAGAAGATYHIGDHVTTDFTLTDALTGETYSLSQFQGSNVLINFFYTT